MSKSEVIRFSNDVRSTNSMIVDILPHGTDQSAILKYAQDKGYNIEESDFDDLLSITPSGAPIDRKDRQSPMVAIVVLVVAVWVWVV